ncbi:hypothetical protein GF371_00685 [Candidatus Woesearchaeota archaeon]|nr:hypothetical protein [Candidatus Woesearchaeota archaeon]
MKYIAILLMLVSLLVIGCAIEEPMQPISNFEECAAAGNPVMESYPRQCSAGGRTFVEEVKLAEETCYDDCPCGLEGAWCDARQKCLNLDEEQCPGSVYTYEQARTIALTGDVTEEQLTGDFVYNENTQTWWFDVDIPKEGCNPAMVIYEKTGSAELNWRCAGLIPE